MDVNKRQAEKTRTKALKGMHNQVLVVLNYCCKVARLVEKLKLC